MHDQRTAGRRSRVWHWQRGTARPYVADRRWVVQARDLALIAGAQGIKVLRPGDDGV
jgi:hypothetical protein